MAKLKATENAGDGLLTRPNPDPWRHGSDGTETAALERIWRDARNANASGKAHPRCPAPIISRSLAAPAMEIGETAKNVGLCKRALFTLNFLDVRRSMRTLKSNYPVIALVGIDSCIYWVREQ